MGEESSGEVFHGLMQIFFLNFKSIFAVLLILPGECKIFMKQTHLAVQESPGSAGIARIL